MNPYDLEELGSDMGWIETGGKIYNKSLMPADLESHVAFQLNEHDADRYRED